MKTHPSHNPSSAVIPPFASGKLAGNLQDSMRPTAPPWPGPLLGDVGVCCMGRGCKAVKCFCSLLWWLLNLFSRIRASLGKKQKPATTKSAKQNTTQLFLKMSGKTQETKKTRTNTYKYNIKYFFLFHKLVLKQKTKYQSTV